MNLADITLQSFRLLLLPFALIYGIIIRIRNGLYDRNILSSTSFNLPVICVGNLSVGGTGKSPMIEYLIRLLKEEYQLAVLSRGYKRKTKGYVLANNQTTALEIGDEPMQFYQKFPGVSIAVGEERVESVPQLLQDCPDTEMILLDDAFQHRSIAPGFSILLTDANNLFTRDFFLPTGDLRDEKSSYKRADAIVVTKCKPGFSEADRKQIMKEIRIMPHQHLYFSMIEYGLPYHILNTKQTGILDKETEVLLITGIANSEPLKKYLEQRTWAYENLSFSDHHIFSIDDLSVIRSSYEKLTQSKKMILTTEKDAVRLIKFGEVLQELPLYVVPIRHKILFDQEAEFREQLLSFITTFPKKSQVQPHA